MRDLKSIEKVNKLKGKLLNKIEKDGRSYIAAHASSIKIALIIEASVYLDLHTRHTKKLLRYLDTWINSTPNERTQANLEMQSMLKELNK